MHINF